MFGGQRRTAQIKTIQKFIGKLKSVKIIKQF